MDGVCEKVASMDGADPSDVTGAVAERDESLKCSNWFSARSSKTS